MNIRKIKSFDWGSLMFELGDGFNAYGAGLRFFGEDNTVQLALHLHWALYVGININWLDRKVKNYEEGWRFGVHVSGRYLTVDLFNADDHSTVFWDWWEWIVGKAVYESRTIASGLCKVILPEKRYEAVFSVKRQSWYYPRWFIEKQADSISIEVDSGIPVPGKGESAWDCGDDAIYSVSSPVDYDSENYSLRKALDDLAMTVLRRRQQYASLDWLPMKKEEEDEMIEGFLQEHNKSK